ncbi:hypothetical protein FGADI_2630 [Fusarium gaditjirri]|uniref:LITAF domain-containing protein n=1 Tax=Fusarium gaditjirri TaxID=282569 RepID=A0A8H4TI37_9HYPO|nr:hypothetical protein FGADI_2630 [Fusarium gaditjirri]
MESSAPNPEHHQHHAHHSAGHDNQQSLDSKSRDSSSPLAQQPPTNPPPTHQQGENRIEPLERARGPSVPINELKSLNAPVVCPSKSTFTFLKKDLFLTQILSVAALALLCMSMGLLVWVPYCISSFKDVIHHCGHCKRPIAEWHRSGRTEVLAHPRIELR